MGETPPDKMMSSWRLLVAAAVILLPLVSSEDPQPAPPPSIDLKTRVEGDTYFIREKCEVTKSAGSLDKLAKMVYATECDVIVHTRKRGLKNLFVEIDIQPTSSKVDKAKSVKIVQGSFSIECNPADKSIVPSSDDSSIDTGSNVVYFTDDRLYCSFIMKYGSDQTSLDKHFENNDKQPKLHFFLTGGQEEVLTYGKTKADLWDEGKARCDPDLASSTPSNDDEYSYSTVDLSRAEDGLKCSTGSLFVKSTDARPVEAASVVCEKEWKWKQKDAPSPVALAEPFTVVCGVLSCSKCSGTTLSPHDCPSCKPPVFEHESNGCSTITCGSSNWILDEKWVEWKTDSTFKCDKDDTGKNYVWKYRIGKEGSFREAKNGACTSEFDCFAFEPLNLNCHANIGIGCKIPKYGDNKKKIVCSEGYSLKWDDSVDKATEFECDVSTGHFVDLQTRVKADPQKNIGCYANPGPSGGEGRGTSSSESKVSSASSSSSIYIVIPVVLVLLLILIATGLFIFILKRRQDAELAREMEEERKGNRHGAVLPPGAICGQALRQKTMVTLAQTKNKQQQSVKSSGSDGSSRSSSPSSRSVDSSGNSSGSNKYLKRKWPKDFKVRTVNRELRAPKVEPFELSSNNIVPGPRNAKNCPELAVSTSMEIQNRNLISKDKPTTTASKSVMTKEGGGPTSGPLIPEKKKTQ